VGLMSNYYSMVSLSVLNIYITSLLAQDAMGNAAMMEMDLYVTSTLNSVFSGIAGSIIFALILHCLKMWERGVEVYDGGNPMFVWWVAIGSLVPALLALRSNWRRFFFCLEKPKRIEIDDDEEMGEEEIPPELVPTASRPPTKSFSDSKLKFAPTSDGKTYQKSISTYSDSAESSNGLLLRDNSPMDTLDSKTLPKSQQNYHSSTTYGKVKTSRHPYSVSTISGDPNPHIVVHSSSDGATSICCSRCSRSSLCQSWGPWIALLWFIQTAGVLALSFAAWEDNQTPWYRGKALASTLKKTRSSVIVDELTFAYVDTSLGLLYCCIDLIIGLCHLRRRISKIVNLTIGWHRTNYDKLKDQLDLYAQKALQAERVKYQTEIKLYGLLRIEQENSRTARQKIEAKCNTYIRKLTSLQAAFERSKVEYTKVTQVANQRTAELRTARFESKMARDENQQMQAQLASAISCEISSKNTLQTLLGSIKDIVRQRGKKIERKSLQRIVEQTEIEVAKESNEGTLPDSDHGSARSGSPARRAAGGATGMPPLSLGSPKIDTKDTNSEAPKVPMTPTSITSFNTQQLKVQDLQAKITVLEEKYRITQRQTITQIKQLEEAVETQASHLKAKESLLSTMTDSLAKIESDNKILTMERNRERKVVRYLENAWNRHKTVMVSKLEWVQAEIIELQRQLSNGSQNEYSARMRKIKQAEVDIRNCKFRLGISVIKPQSPTTNSSNPEQYEVAGIHIEQVDEQSPLYTQNLRKGQVIVYVNATRTDSHRKIVEIMERAKPGDYISMLTTQSGSGDWNPSNEIFFRLPFELRETKLNNKALRDIQRLELGLVRKQDLDQKDLGRDHKLTLKARQRKKY